MILDLLEENFFDRQRILKILNRRVVGLKDGYRQNLALLGKKFIGKSSILKRFVQELADENIIPIYLDLDAKDFYYFFYNTAGQLLYNFLKTKNIPPADDLTVLIEHTKKYLPRTTQLIQKSQHHVAKGKIGEAYRSVLALPEIFTAESGNFCVIILDEFHNFGDWDIPNVFQELGKRIMTQHRCLYIVSSSLPVVAKDILFEKLALLFGNFEIIDVEPFDLQTSRDFIEKNLVGLTMSPVLRDFLIDFCDGHPFYLGYICREILSLSMAHSQKDVYAPLFIQALENTVFNTWGVIRRHFESVVETLSQGRAAQMVTALLVSLADGYMRRQAVVSTVSGKKSLARQRLNKLIELGIVEKNGSFCYLGDRLFKFWVKYVYQKKRKSFRVNLNEERLQFRKELMNLIDNFQRTIQKDIRSRIIDLLSCFDNEAFCMNGRNYKLPVFREVLPIKEKGCSEGVEIIRAKTEAGVWYILVKESSMNEADINAVLKELRGGRKRLQKGVIISLGELDMNARLKALQEKMWVWSRKEINTLLNLYNKPYIIQ